jgi:hypothetical protein
MSNSTATTTPARGTGTGTVRYDADKSTRWTAAYVAPSKSQPGRTHIVTHDLRTGAWHCPCLARVECWHIKAARDVERIRWWSVLIADMQPQHRDDFLAVLRSRLGSVYATDDDRIAWSALVAYRAGRRVAA